MHITNASLSLNFFSYNFKYKFPKYNNLVGALLHFTFRKQ